MRLKSAIYILGISTILLSCSVKIEKPSDDSKENDKEVSGEWGEPSGDGSLGWNSSNQFEGGWLDDGSNDDVGGAYDPNARVDRSVMVRASAMDRSVAVTFIVPDNGPEDARYPVIYMLNGHGGTDDNWIREMPKIKRIAEEKGIIIACPHGNDSWYWDSPVQRDYQFETFIYKDLVEYTDENYPTIRDRTARAITGFSMGGHGALWNAVRHQDVFGAVGSMSGGVDFCHDSSWSTSWNIQDRLGPRATNEEVWRSHTVMSQLDKLSDGALAIIFDCGTGDFFYKVNNNLHDALAERGIEHIYDTRAGGHDWAFWRVSTESHINFFEAYFTKGPDAAISGDWRKPLGDETLDWGSSNQFE